MEGKSGIIRGGLYTYSEDFGMTWASPELLANNAFLTYDYTPLDLVYSGDEQFLVFWKELLNSEKGGAVLSDKYTTLTFPRLEEEPVPMPLIGAEGKPVQTLIHCGAILLLFCGLFVVSIRSMKSSAS